MISVQKVLKGLKFAKANFQIESFSIDETNTPNSLTTFPATVPAEHLLPVGKRTANADVLSAGDDHESEAEDRHQSLVAHHTGRHLLLGLRNLRFESERNDRPRSADEFGVSSLFWLCSLIKIYTVENFF